MTYWHRFDHDILVRYTGITRHLNVLENISLTTEIEQGNPINFLYITIIELHISLTFTY